MEFQVNILCISGIIRGTDRLTDHPSDHPPTIHPTIHPTIRPTIRVDYRRSCRPQQKNCYQLQHRNVSVIIISYSCSTVYTEIGPVDIGMLPPSLYLHH